MRRIKFRAWDKEKKIMIYDDRQDWADNYDLKIGARLHNTVWAIGNYYNTLMQFTGLLAANEIELYEEDIVNDICSEEISIIQYCKIDFGDDFRLCQVDIQTKKPRDDFYGGLYWVKDLEIIGNIYENKELLKNEL